MGPFQTSSIIKIVKIYPYPHSQIYKLVPTKAISSEIIHLIKIVTCLSVSVCGYAPGILMIATWLFWCTLQVYIQTTLLVPQIYTSIHNHQHRIIQLSWIHLVDTFIIWTFDIAIPWILIHLSANWWIYEQIVFQN